MRLDIRIISPILQITIGLLMLTLSLLLMGDLLGFVPNQKQSRIDARKSIAESLAIQLTFEAGQDRMKEATELLNIIVDRNEQVLSVGLRSDSGQMVMQSDGHSQYWPTKEDGRSTPDHIKVPIFSQQGRWGTLELSFKPLDSLWDELFTGRSFAAMLLFILISGSLAYWLFLKRVLSELDPSSVIPDRVRSALDALTEGLAILDPSERIVLINASFEKKLALSEADLIGKKLSSLEWEVEIDPLLGRQRLPWSVLFVSGETPSSSTIKLKTPDQGMLTFDVNLAPIRSPDQRIKGMIVTIDDVTELEKKNHELARILDRLEKSQEEISRQNLELIELATRDPLTNLLNRRSLFEGMDDLLRETRERSDVLSCMMLDIDFFKAVNDNLGHAAGDRVIQVFAEIIQLTVRSNDLVGRYGGEEFVVVLPGLDESQAHEIAERIRISVMQRSFDELSKGFKITSSFGVSSTQGDVWKSDKLIDHADQALYVAKLSGRNRVISYSKKNIDHIDGPNPLIEPVISPEVEHEEVETEVIEETSEETPTISRQVPERSTHSVILDRLSQAIRQAHRDKTNLAVLTIYIDTIQTVNNTLGHASAEKLRKIAYKRLIETFRESDSVTPETDLNNNISLSRSSDGEFTAILSGIEQAAVTTWVIHRMAKELAIPVEIDGNEIVMTANVGGSIYPVDGEHPDVLRTNSKMALQESVQEGKEAFLFFDKEMNVLSKQQLHLESQLYLALEREEFHLDFQPIVSIKTGRVNKLEALIRWRHPELGMVSPADFIEIAEHVGLIKPIGRWIVQTAARHLKGWQSSGHPYLNMSINLSPVQLKQSQFTEDLIEIVDSEGLSSRSIVLELTETAIIKRLDHVVENILRLHSAGFQITLDDFGTGYSSLNYLRKLPISWVKIDRSVIENIPDDMNDVSIVSGLIGLSHNLGMRVVAEGVEHESQLLTLHDLKCDEVQGYLMSRPLSAEHVIKFLESTDSRRMMRKVNMAEIDTRDLGQGASLAEILNSPPST